MKKAVVLHSVAANGGDELLNMVLKKGLKEISNIYVTAYTTNNKLSTPFLDGEVFMDGYLSGSKIYPNKINKIIRNIDIGKVGIIRKLIEKKSPKASRLLKHINDSDCVILCPGGYIHEYYGIISILEMVKRVKAIPKPIYLFAHSLGPFNNTANIAKKILNKVDKVILREQISNKYLKSLGNKVHKKSKVTTDIAFAYNKLFNYNPEHSLDDSRRVLLNFRNWKHSKEPANVLSKGKRISEVLFENGYDLEFLSTCQGVNGYTDDSKVAEEIVRRARQSNPDFEATIHTQRYEPEQLLRVMEGAAFYVGMRLHGAISAMLAHVPAFNIGYEHKSEGVYRTVGLPNYTVDITAPIDKILGRVESFAKEDPVEQRERVRKALDTAEEKALETFELI